MLFIFYFFFNNFLINKDIFSNPSSYYTDKNFIKNIAKVILSCVYSLFIVILIALALGFLLSLSSNLSTSNYLNFINPMFNISKLFILLILLLVIILFILSLNFKKILDLKYPFVFFATCIQTFIFIGLLFFFKSISDYILSNILTSPDIRNMNILDTNEKITTEKMNRIQNNIQSLSDLFTVDDYSAIDNNNLNYLIFLFLYFVYMLTIAIGFIALLKFKINYEKVSFKFGEKIIIKMKQLADNLGIKTIIFNFEKTS